MHIHLLSLRGNPPLFRELDLLVNLVRFLRMSLQVFLQGNRLINLAVSRLRSLLHCPLCNHRSYHRVVRADSQHSALPISPRAYLRCLRVYSRACSQQAHPLRNHRDSRPWIPRHNRLRNPVVNLCPLHPHSRPRHHRLSQVGSRVTCPRVSRQGSLLLIPPPDLAANPVLHLHSNLPCGPVLNQASIRPQLPHVSPNRYQRTSHLVLPPTNLLLNPLSSLLPIHRSSLL